MFYSVLRRALVIYDVTRIVWKIYESFAVNLAVLLMKFFQLEIKLNLSRKAPNL